MPVRISRADVSSCLCVPDGALDLVTLVVASLLSGVGVGLVGKGGMVGIKRDETVFGGVWRSGLVKEGELNEEDNWIRLQ
eukprot:scaffold46699_cov33-Attheya_sp.AAC.1